MSTFRSIKDSLKNALRKRGYHAFRISEEDRAIIEECERSSSSSAADFGSRLSVLDDLRRRYAQVRLPITSHSIWQARGASETRADVGRMPVDLPTFRGDNAYLFSYGSPDPLSSRLKYYIDADAVRRKDAARLLGRLQEDGAFGCLTFEYPGLGRVSRDLLDSVSEINFLQKHLGVLDQPNLNVLDVGAGYGRMAHRMLEASPRIASYTCVDAVPESTFLCELYLEHRHLLGQARVIPLDELEQRLPSQKYDLAINVHSFAECTFAAIAWWLGQLKTLGVPRLLIVQSGPELFVSTERDQTRRDYRHLLDEHGYEQVAQELLFEDPAAQEVMQVRDHMFLFRLT